MRERARDTATKADLNQLWSAIAIYQIDYQDYPSSSARVQDMEWEIGEYLTALPDEQENINNLTPGCGAQIEWYYYINFADEVNNTVASSENTGIVLSAWLGGLAWNNPTGNCADFSRRSIVTSGQSTYAYILDAGDGDEEVENICENNLTQAEADDLNIAFSVNRSIDQWCTIWGILVESDTDLTYIPDSVGKLDQLTYFRLFGNHNLTSIPDSVWNLSNLTRLDLNYNNGLTTVPDSLWNLSNLTYLSIQYSRINPLPASMWNLSNLETVYFYRHWNLQEMPESFSNRTNLRYISISDLDGITTLPSGWTVDNLSNINYFRVRWSANLVMTTELSALCLATNQSCQ